mmetsp:Transcript_24751/g.51799  ORF Transcript_24751/g.51799 Transcript_24751/m.51799 type:complete len:238 (+) Transcript_24751:304-1017(+)
MAHTACGETCQPDLALLRPRRLGSTLLAMSNCNAPVLDGHRTRAWWRQVFVQYAQTRLKPCAGRAATQNMLTLATSLVRIGKDPIWGEELAGESERDALRLKHLLDQLIRWPLSAREEKLWPRPVRLLDEDVPVGGIRTHQRDLGAAARELRERVDRLEAELGDLALGRRLASQKASDRTDDAALARQRIERVISLSPLRVDHQHWPVASALAHVLDGAQHLRRRLHKRHAVIGWPG